MEELTDEVPSMIHFDVGYYKKRSSKCWLVTTHDLAEMYSGLKSDEILLWCDAEASDDKRDVRREMVRGKRPHFRVGHVDNDCFMQLQYPGKK